MTTPLETEKKGPPLEWWRRFIYSGKERYLSAQECLKLRLVDEVCQFLDECYLPTAYSASTEGNQ